MKTGGTTARLLVAATLGHFRCPATRAASSRMPAGLAIAGDLGVAERPLRPGRLAWLENRLWPIPLKNSVLGRRILSGPIYRSSDGHEVPRDHRITQSDGRVDGIGPLPQIPLLSESDRHMMDGV
jgi:hypothetical protein